MCPKHDTPCVLPEARGYTSWSASLTHWTADLWPLISPESQSDPAAHSPALAGSLGSQLTQQYCVMLSYESPHTSAPPLHSGNQCQTKWTLRPCVCVCVCLCVCVNLYGTSFSSNNNYYCYCHHSYLDASCNNLHLCMSQCVCLYWLARSPSSCHVLIFFFPLHTSLLIQTLISPYVDITKRRGMGGGRWIEKIEHLLEQMRHGGRSKRAHLYDP